MCERQSGGSASAVSGGDGGFGAPVIAMLASAAEGVVLVAADVFYKAKKRRQKKHPSEKDADKKQWQEDAVVAMSGLGMLGSEEFVPTLTPLLGSKHGEIRLGAANAMTRCLRPGQIAAVKESMQHS